VSGNETTDKDDSDIPSGSPNLLPLPPLYASTSSSNDVQPLCTIYEDTHTNGTVARQHESYVNLQPAQPVESLHTSMHYKEKQNEARLGEYQ
jgi:hypothetical protein